jgi:hypothetical protein
MAEYKKLLTAAFRRRSDAAAAHEWLQSRGYTSGEINVLMSDATRRALREDDSEAPLAAGNMANEGVAAGGAIGTAVGATLAAIAAIGTSIAIPGLSIVLAGPLVAALAGGGAGAVAGGILGGLIGLGIPESNAQAYEAVLRDGGVIFGVHPRSPEDATEIEEYFRNAGAENIVYTS